MSFTESHYENAILQLFQERLGYTYIYGPDADRDYHSPLYEDALLPALHRINRSLPEEAITEAVYKLKNFEGGSLLQKNMVFVGPSWKTRRSARTCSCSSTACPWW